MSVARSSALAVLHGFRDSVRWRVTPRGVEVNGRIERTPGPPTTVTNVWETYHKAINAAAGRYGVPAQLIIATICTESGGRAKALRLEPRYRSDEATPDQVSPGLMQTLISTARSALGNQQINRAWLMKPRNSIMAGTAYIRRQANTTRLDPPLVACAYNAGSLRYNSSKKNRWRMVQYPIGTSAHCDRFISWFNDACAVLARHPIRPAVGLEVLIIGVAGHKAGAKSVTKPKMQAKATTAKPKAGGAAAAARRISIAYAAHAKSNEVTPYSRRVLADILRNAGLRSATISSTSRTPAEQAHAMFENLEQLGVAKQKQLYGPFGDLIIDVYARGKAAGKTAAQIEREMTKRIVAVGPTNVSHHAADPKILNVFDVAPLSIPRAKWAAFEQAVAHEKRVSKFFKPPQDPGFHLEIPQHHG